MVSRDSFHVVILNSKINDMDVNISDIKGAYLSVPCKENVCFGTDNLSSLNMTNICFHNTSIL